MFSYFAAKPWRMVRRGGLRPLVLRILASSPSNGAEVMDEIEKFTWGWWRPSPGSVYPLLEEMTQEGLVRKREDGRYELTEKGKQEIEWPFMLRPGQPGSVEDMLNEANGILMYLEDLKTSDKTKLQPYMDRIKKMAERINRIVE